MLHKEFGVDGPSVRLLCPHRTSVITLQRRKEKKMKTKVLLITAVLGLSLFATPAHAAGEKTLVIIDSGINMQLPWAKAAVVEEACFVDFGSCSNNLSSMIGPGAATLDPALVKDKAMSHGTQMASAAVATNPNVKIVFIRIVSMSAKGFANTYTTRAVSKAMDWVTANAERLNVGAVSISIGRVYKEAACPVLAEPKLQSQIVGLAAINIPTVISAGNNSDKNKINYPACIPEAIAVGATDTPYAMKEVTGWVYPIMLISNSGPDLDLYALGRATTADVQGNTTVTLGTSNATVVVATRLAQSLSDGSTLGVVMDRVKASLQTAYRTLTNFELKFYQT